MVRWVGQGGKTSLTNTADADILDYILVKLAARIVVKTRTFLVKVKTHRGETLNEGTDDLVEAGRSLTKEGEGYRWKQRTTHLVFLYYDRISSQCKKKHMEQDYSKHNKERSDGISVRRTTVTWSKQVEEGTV